MFGTGWCVKCEVRPRTHGRLCTVCDAERLNEGAPEAPSFFVKCDARCSARSVSTFTTTQMALLTFCGHHATKLRPALNEQGFFQD